MNLVEMRDIRKSYYGVEVLHGVDFTLRAGTVHALMGENGAGKSTLMKGLAGVHLFDHGSICIQGQNVRMETPFAARACGVAMIHQELSPVLEMSVAENIFLGREPRRMGLLNRKKMYDDTEQLLKRLNIRINPRAQMKHLRVADQQMIEIAKAISQNASIVIMDEPTSSITDKEVGSLFKIINDLKAQGTGIVYISHKMDEIFRIADEITVLRDGALVQTWPIDQVDQHLLIKSMVGRELKEQFPSRTAQIGDVILSVRHLSLAGQYEDISFDLHRDEILGFVGLIGAGRTELMRSIFGLSRPDSGEIWLNGRPVFFRSPKDAIQHGIAYVTEDRKGEGLVLPMNIRDNTTLVRLKDFARMGLLSQIQEKRAVLGQLKALNIRAKSVAQTVSSLSGGNQQKVVLAKWMITDPDIMIFDEPTRGIDVGAKAEIYQIMNAYVHAGHAVMMVSSEIPEAMGMSDRLIALSNHKMSGEIDRKNFSQEVIVKAQFKHMMDSAAAATQDGSGTDE